MIGILLVQIIISLFLGTPPTKNRDWAVYGGGPESIRLFRSGPDKPHQCPEPSAGLELRHEGRF